MSLVFIATMATFGALVLVAYELLVRAEDRATVRASLRAIEDYDPVEVRERELMVPLTQRVIQPVGRSLAALARRLMPAGYMEGIRRKLLVAGRPGPEALDRFRVVRVLSVAAVPVAFFVVLVLLPLPPRIELPVFGFVALLAVLGPDLALNRQVAERQHEIRVRLPDILDLLTISVEAGLGFEQALDRTVTTVPGPLSEEFQRMLGELRAGASRADALRNLEARTDVPELRSFILAIIQADTFGVSIGRILRSQADEMRVKRRQLAQEEAQKAPVKLMFPTVFCILPALFVVVMGPAVISVITSAIL